MQVFQDAVIVGAPVQDVFRFYMKLENIARMTPPEFRMRVVSAQIPLKLGSRVRFSVRHRSVPVEVRWESVICEFIENQRFADRQVRGPFEHWVHRHEFQCLGDGRTEVIDTIECGAPLGLLGRIAESLLLGSQIDHIFHHRRKVLRRELERPHEAPAAPPASGGT